MNLKKWLQTIWDHERGLQERMFRLLMSVALAALFIMLIVAVCLGEGVVNMLTLGGGFLLFLAITLFSVRFGKIQLGAALVATIFIFLVLPMLFFTGGGIYGGSPLWFVFCALFVSMVMQGKRRVFFLAGIAAVTAVCYYIAYTYRNASVVAVHSIRMTYMTSFVSVLIVAVLISITVIFQSSIYISEQRIAEAQKKEIEELNRAQNRFFSSMSHEIRTPINTILGLDEMILRDADSEEVAEDAKNIQGAGKMLLSLINDLLDMSKIEAGKMEVVPVVYDVGDMLSELVGMMWIRMKDKGLDFHVDVDKTLPSKLIGDEVRIKQVLINLLNNAVKYTETGSVTLSIRLEQKVGNYAVLVYSVEDTGMGIRKESVPHLFDAFSRADVEKNRYIEGTGLGLSIVKQIVDLMGGEISVNSIYTKGSTFVVTLGQEIADEAELGELNTAKKHAIDREQYRQSFEAPGANVLIVDDNDANLLVATKLLRDTRVGTETAGSGAEALKKTLWQHYDVILMDHLMPGMDGIECMHAIRAQVGGLNRETPIVVLTANAGSDDRERYRSEGFDGYLLKPVNASLLEEAMLKHLPKELVTLTGTAEETQDNTANPILEHRVKLPVLITTDSTCDLPPHILERRQIAVIPYWVHTEDAKFLDGEEIETDGIFSYTEEQGKNAYSEAPSVKEYEDFFAEQLTRAYHIVHISTAKNVGRGYEHAKEASRSFDNVQVVNSGQISGGIGLLAMYAERLVGGGAGADRVIEEIKRVRAKVSCSFITGTTEYLFRAGRMSRRMNELCKALMLHPVIAMKDSAMKVGTIRFGVRETLWKGYISYALDRLRGINKELLFVDYAGMSPADLKEIEALICEKTTFKEIVFQKASPAITVNCGPGTFGLVYMLQ